MHNPYFLKRRPCPWLEVTPERYDMYIVFISM